MNVTTQKLIANLKLHQNTYKKILIKLHEKHNTQSSKKWRGGRSTLINLHTIYFENDIQIFDIPVVLKSEKKEAEKTKKSNIIDLENINSVLLALNDEERRTAVDMKQFTIQAAADFLHNMTSEHTWLKIDLDSQLEVSMHMWDISDSEN